MKGTIRATVKVAGRQREHKFVKGTPARVITAWKKFEAAKLRKKYPVASEPRPTASGTFAADVAEYLPLVKHLGSWSHRRSEIRAWLPHFKDKYRRLITTKDVQRIRGIWVEQGLRHKTINNRVTALRNLFHVLDGDKCETPCDGIKQLEPQKVPPKMISPELVERVAEALRFSKRKHAAADRARLMVLASTGKRPVEIERAEPGDVDLKRRVWLTRDAKGGYSPGMYLNDEMLAAWEAFVAANAWGKIPDHFPRRLRDAGWPDGLKPYHLRHSTWIEASERGFDLSDIQAGAGHKRMSTTRRHYVPVLNSRMQRLSQGLAGRFTWQPASQTDENAASRQTARLAPR